MSEELQQFYDALGAWVNNGCPDDTAFCKHYGLCDNLTLWCFAFYIESWHGRELKLQFKDAGLDCTYPFGDMEYYKSVYAGTMYDCPKRLKWIKDHMSKENV